MSQSKTLDNTANKNRLQHVGSLLTASRPKRTRELIDQWFDDNPQAVSPIWDLLDTGMVWSLIGEAATTSKSCTKLDLLMVPMLTGLLKTKMPALDAMDRNGIANMKAQDSKVLVKLRMQCWNLSPTYGMKGGMAVTELTVFLNARDVVLGGRIRHIEVKPDGSIDWYVSGIYLFGKAKAEPGENGRLYELILDKAHFNEADIVVHRFSGKTIPFTNLGVTSITEAWSIGKNWCEQGAFMSNGKSLSIDLWAEMDSKGDAYFDYDKKVTDHMGGDTWKQSFGNDMVVERKKALKTAQEKAKEAKDALDEVAKYAPSSKAAHVSKAGAKRTRIR